MFLSLQISDLRLSPKSKIFALKTQKATSLILTHTHFDIIHSEVWIWHPMKQIPVRINGKRNLSSQ